MLSKLPVHVSDLRAYSRLAVEATIGITDLCENLHHNISLLPGVFSAPVSEPASGITGFVYRSIRGVTRKVGSGVDGVLSLLPAPRSSRSSASREALLAALNGVIGDHLAATANPLQITMSLRSEGRRIELERSAIARDIAQPTRRIVVLVHGLCMSDLQWRRNGHDHGAALAADAGFTPIYAHYNSGLHISTNGRLLADQLEALVAAWPAKVEELTIIGYSMGGLLARSACHYGAEQGHAWPRSVRRIVFLGTPHGGSPLERNGSRLDAMLGSSPYTAALARLGRVRSAGITDLRDARLVDEDWENSGCMDPELRHAPALPEGVQCFAIAGSIAKKPGSLRGRLIGDGLVPVESALGSDIVDGAALSLSAAHQWVGYGIGHLGLLDDRRVYERLRDWLR